MELNIDRISKYIPNKKHGTYRKPYPFQQKAFDALDCLKERHPEGISTMLVLPTGAGKTYTAVHWIIKNYINKGIKVLWVAHRSELLRQAAECFYSDTTEETLPDRDGFISIAVSSEYCRSADINPARPDVVIASRQSICSGSNIDFYIKWAKGNGLKADRKLLIVFDEAHHAAAKSYRDIIKTMRKYIPHTDVLGLTATPCRTARSEQGSLKKLFSTENGIVYSIDMSTLIKEGYLANPRNIEVNTDIDMTDIFSPEELYKIGLNDLTSIGETNLKKFTENQIRNSIIVNTYIRSREKFGKTVVFAVDVANAVALNEIFKANGIKSDCVVSSFPNEHNANAVKNFRKGICEVLINVNILTEGTDIPDIQTVFLARPTTSKILMTQMIGRGLRNEASGGTKEANLVYFIDEWRGKIEFVSPQKLLDGEDVMSDSPKSTGRKLFSNTDFSEVCRVALKFYKAAGDIEIKCNNIIPYGIIECRYRVNSSQYGVSECTKDIIVYDESADVYSSVLEEIFELYNGGKIKNGNTEIKNLAEDLYFKYTEEYDGEYIEFSIRNIYHIIRTCAEHGKVPVIKHIENRVNPYETAKKIFRKGYTDSEKNAVIRQEWDNNSSIREWFNYDSYRTVMEAYFEKLDSVEIESPDIPVIPKERMDMGELRKHYYNYWLELKNYVYRNAFKDGYYYSAIQDGDKPVRSKNRKDFEIDHIIPISKGGNTVKENLQLLTREQNRRLGAKDKK